MKQLNLKERLERLTAAQRRLLYSLAAGTVKDVPGPEGRSIAPSRLVAFYVAEGTVSKTNIRDALTEKLPAHLIPHRLVELPQLPQLPNGKVDLKALETHQLEGQEMPGEHEPADRTVEDQLTGIWEEVLQVRPVRPDDNFFEIGGDSMLSIQVVARAKKLGIALTPTQIFEQQTIKALVAHMPEETQERQAVRPYSGPVPLSPIQHWFFEEHRNAPHHWNDVVHFELDVRLNSAMVEKAVAYLTERHEALRLRFIQEGEKWLAEILSPADIAAFQTHTVSHLPKPEQDNTIREKIHTLQHSFELAKGSLFQIVYFGCGPGQPDRLCFFAHHLLFDNISLKVLFDELSALLEQLAGNESMYLPTVETPYHEWAENLAAMAGEKIFQDDLEFWKEQQPAEGLLPTDRPAEYPILEETVELVDIEFIHDFTYRQLKSACDAYQLRMEELLLSALLRTLGNWSGLSRLCVGLEAHGRKALPGQKDLSDLVGWITSFFPLTLPAGAESTTGSLLKAVKSGLRSVPDGGLSYGVLRYLAGRKELTHSPPLIFNYLGKQNDYFSGVLKKERHIARDANTRSPLSERYHAFEVNTFFADDTLHLWWSYSRALHDRETIDELTGRFELELGKIVDFCQTTDDAGYVNSDFPDAGLSQEDLDQLLDQI